MREIESYIIDHREALVIQREWGKRQERTQQRSSEHSGMLSLFLLTVVAADLFVLMRTQKKPARQQFLQRLQHSMNNVCI